MVNISRGQNPLQLSSRCGVRVLRRGPFKVVTMIPNRQSQAPPNRALFYLRCMTTRPRANLLTILDSGKRPPIMHSRALSRCRPTALPCSVLQLGGEDPLDASILRNGRSVAATEHLSAALRAGHRAEPTVKRWGRLRLEHLSRDDAKEERAK